MDHLVGKFIDDKFRVVRKVGEGAMGIVYVAEALEYDGTEVAIKVMRRTTNDPAAPERFLREAEALAALNCPQIVQLYGFDRDMTHGILYVAMEYARGDDLNSILAYGRAKPELVLDVIEQVCNGLVEAHRHGIWHRDLKPANLKLVQEEGELVVKILDFGLVRVRGDRARLTDQGKAPGTLSYMSPDELQELDLDGRIDIYSLGVIAYEMLTGRPPFIGNVPLETAKLILTAHPEALDAVLPEPLPKGLPALIGAMMRRDRDERIGNAEQLRELVGTLRRDARLQHFEPQHDGESTDLRRDYDLLPAL